MSHDVPPPPPVPAGASSPRPTLPPPGASGGAARPAAGAGPTPPTPRPAPLDDRERGLDPRIMQVWRLSNAVGCVFLLGPPAVLAPVLLGRVGALVTLAALAIGGSWLWWWPGAQFRRWRWRLTEQAVELRHGLVVHRHQAVPYFRIQQIDVTQGPLDRLLGLATLQVTTASASGSASLPGLAAEDAPRVRVDLLARASAAVAEHEGELRDAV